MTASSSLPSAGRTTPAHIACAETLLSQNPADALAYVETLLPLAADWRLFEIAAAACRATGQSTDAEDAELAGIKASFKIVELEDAALAGEQGRNDDARRLVSAFLHKHPTNLLALTMAAEADLHAWDLERAEQRLLAVLARAPTFLRAVMLQARCLMLQARLKEAITILDRVLERRPGNRTIMLYRAQLAAEANDHVGAAQGFREILDRHPSDAQLWVVYAQELRILGAKSESKAAFRRALELAPDDGAAWWGLVNFFPADVGEPELEAIDRSLTRISATSRDAAPLLIARSILLDRQGDLEGAFSALSAGKKIRARSAPYDRLQASRNVERLLDVFTAEQYRKWRGQGHHDASPIFIIGMPRSGSTLLERILGCHSAIEAAGELPILPRLHERRRRHGPDQYAQDLERLKGVELAQLGRWYVERAADYRTTKRPKFVDKLNSNWFHAGLIRGMLPAARIINIRRNPLDCCWSNFRMLFAEGHVAANDMRDIASFYRDYVRMVEAVDNASPGGVLHIDYESLVEDVEGETRRALRFLGLDFEQACIEFHRSQAPSATPSSEQVRRPINRDGIGSADRYRPWLGPMIEELGTLLKKT